MKTQKRLIGFLSPFKITVIYLIVATFWITFTDQVLELLVTDTETLTQFQTYKGFFYVIATSLGLYLLIKKYASQLNRSLREQETLLQEVHHRVKNNLAVVSGFLQMQRMETDSEIVDETLSKSETRIKSIALIHEKLYRSDSLSEVDFKSYLQDLRGSIVSTLAVADGVDITITSDPVLLNINQAVPCAIILNELITNALLHAFTNGTGNSKIEVTLTEKDEVIRIKVLDNGEGFPKEFDMEDHGSMGFSIIKTLTEQLDAEYQIDNTDGTAVTFAFNKRSNGRSL